MSKKLATAVMVLGMLVSAYAAIVFFGRMDWPPNTELSRLPSLYLLGGGMLTMFCGVVVRGFL